MTSLADPLVLDHGPAWPNRFALAPLTNTQSHADGTCSDEEQEWLVARGRGGFGLVMTCAAYVSTPGQAWAGQLGIAREEHEPGLTRLAEALRATGTRSSVQLHHGGRRSDPAVSGVPNQCPWDEPSKQAVAMTTAEVEQMVSDFVAAAVRAERCGFDGVELHGAHGYLLAQFLDARNNQRTDAYGGSLEARRRPIDEVVAGIRAATGPDFQLGIRLTLEGNGIPLDDGLAVAGHLLGSGELDYVDASLWDVFASPRHTDDETPLIDLVAALPRGTTRLGVAGLVRSTADAQWCLDHGADVVSVGKGAIWHHDFATRALADAAFTVRPHPVTDDDLLAEAVSPRFVDYLKGTFPDVVA
ncbi:MAG: NADH:flavin oxidoreductase [Nocardioides sp.]|nr:NADH:flavin oxidoreductase [Nocardioides sp.]